MLVIRTVWSDETAADTASDTTFAAYASSFVDYVNARGYGNIFVTATFTAGCIYKLPGHTSAQALDPANSNSLAGWIFGDIDNALANAAPGCVYSPSAFTNIFVAHWKLPNAGWAGVGFQPGSRFITQVRVLLCILEVQKASTSCNLHLGFTSHH
jgi:hypothetical protein